jgi:hypothetical protein
MAAQETVEQLLQQPLRNRNEQNEPIQTTYMVKIGDDEIPLPVISSRPNFEMIIKNNPILKKEHLVEEGFDIVLDTQYSYAKLNEKIEIKFKVELVGDETRLVELYSDDGSILPQDGKAPFGGTWHIKSFDKPGKYLVSMLAKSGDVTKEYKVSVDVEGEQKLTEVDVLIPSMEGQQLIEIQPDSILSFRLASDALERLNIESRARAKVTVDKNIFFEISDLNIILSSFLLQRFAEFKDQYESLYDRFEYHGTIQPEKPVTLDRRIISAFQNISKKARFLVRSKEINN